MKVKASDLQKASQSVAKSAINRVSTNPEQEWEKPFLSKVFSFIGWAQLFCLPLVAFFYVVYAPYIVGIGLADILCSFAISKYLEYFSKTAYYTEKNTVLLEKLLSKLEVE
jgi:hypothetical protein